MRTRQPLIDRAIVVLSAVVLLVAAATLALNPAQALADAGWRLGVMTIALALVVPLHLRLPSGMDASPLAPSIGLAMVLTPLSTAQNALTGTALVVVALAVGTMVGVGLSSLVGQGRTSLAMLGSRLIGATAAALLFRNMPIIGGESPASAAQGWLDDPWRTALAMTLCGLVAIAVDLGLLVLCTAAPGRLRTQGEQLAREIGPVWLAVLGVAVAIALGFGPLDLWSVPVMASPLLLMRTALRRQAAIVRVRHDTIAALGQLTDGTGYTTTGHGRRVRDLAREVGLQLMLSDRELRDLETAALMHDVGQLGLTDPIPGGATSEAAPSDQAAIAIAGARVVRTLGGMERVAEIIEQQTTPYRNVREFGEDVPIECRVLKVCNAYDDLTQGRPEARAEAIERISLGMGYEYDPDVVDLLTHAGTTTR